MIRLFETFRTKQKSFESRILVEQVKFFSSEMRLQEVLLVCLMILRIFGQDCGIKRSLIGTIVGGISVKNRAEWPWLVAFVYKFSGSFFCSGSLISRKHIVSGAVIFLKK